MLPELSEALKIPRLTNTQVRPTAIRKMVRAGIDDRTIMGLTKQKKVETVRNYDPECQNDKKIERAFAIFAPKKKLTSSILSALRSPNEIETVERNR